MTAEEELVSRAQAGDRQAFEDLYRGLFKNVYRFIYHWVSDAPTTEDLTQTVFLKVWQSLPRYSAAKGSFKTYTLSIARHQAIDFLRRKKELRLNPEYDLPSDDPSPVEAAGREESRTLLRQALAQLDEEDRQVLIIYHFENMSIDELSASLGKSAGATRVCLHRLGQKLKKVLVDLGYESGGID